MRHERQFGLSYGCVKAPHSIRVCEDPTLQTHLMADPNPNAFLAGARPTYAPLHLRIHSASSSGLLVSSLYSPEAGAQLSSLSRPLPPPPYPHTQNTCRGSSGTLCSSFSGAAVTAAVLSLLSVAGGVGGSEPWASQEDSRRGDTWRGGGGGGGGQ